IADDHRCGLCGTRCGRVFGVGDKGNLSFARLFDAGHTRDLDGIRITLESRPQPVRNFLEFHDVMILVATGFWLLAAGKQAKATATANVLPRITGMYTDHRDEN